MRNIYFTMFFVGLFLQSTFLFAQPNLTVWHVSPDHLENHDQGVSNLWGCGYEYYLTYTNQASSSRDFILVLRNEGDEALNLDLPLTLDSGSSSDFSIVTQPAKATLQPNERTHLVLSYSAPATYNDATASLAIGSNDGDAASCSFSFDVGSIIGTPIPSTPPFEILCDGEVVFPPNGGLVIFDEPTSGINIGNVLVGDCGDGPVSKTFTIRNNTDINLSVGPSPFCGFIIIENPFPDDGPQDDFSAGEQAFANADPSIISIIGEGADCFSVTTEPTGTIPANGTVDFVVEFDPNIAGDKLVILCFNIFFGFLTLLEEAPIAGGGVFIPIAGTAENCPLEFASNNDLMFGDPCACGDPRNCSPDGEEGPTFFHDTLTVTGGPGLTLTAVAGATDFFSGVECFGNANMVIPAGTIIPESPAGSGTYKIEFWRLSGTVPTLTINDGTTNHVVPAATFGSVCTDAACTPMEPIPTMSEWGLILFGLLIINLGVFFVRKRELMLE